MQFVVLSSDLHSRLSSTIDDAFRSERQCLSQAITRFRSQSFVVLATQLQVSRQSAGFFDGYVFGSPLLHAYRSQWSEINFAALTERASEAAGVFVAVHCDAATNRFRIVTDPIGQYTLFYWQVGQDFLVSNNLYLVRNLLQRIGVDAAANPINAALNITHMSSFGGVSPIDPIKVLSPRYSLQFSNRLTVKEMVSRKALTHQPGQYHERLVQTAEAITAHCRAIAEIAQDGTYVISDLSGGVDSRMNMAGFLNAGARSQIKFFCTDSGDSTKPTPDRIASDYLVHQFNLRTGGALWDSKNSTASYTTAAKVLAGTHRYFGLLPVVFEDYGDLRIPDYCRVGGYCGEHTRAFGPPHPELPKTADAAAASFSAYYGERGRRLFTRDGHQAVSDAFRDYFAEVLSEVSDPKLLNMVAYFENRSRYHFGLRSQIGNSARLSFSPLVEPGILALQRYLPYSEIAKNRIARDLIVEMAGRAVADAPLAHGWWGRDAFSNQDEYLPYRDKVEDFAIKGNKKPLAPQNDYSFFRIDDKRGVVDTEFDRSFVDPGRYPKELASKDPNFVIYAELVRYNTELIPAGDVIWQLFDRNQMFHVSEILDPTNEKQRLTMMRLASSLSFYSGASKCGPLSGTGSVYDLCKEWRRSAA